MKNICTPQRLFRITRLNFAIAFLVNVTACNGLSKDAIKSDAEATLTGGLLIVRFEEILTPPEFIRLVVRHSEKDEKAQFLGKINQNSRGNYTDYLVALSLPPGSYVLDDLRGLANASTRFVALDLPFIIEPDAPGYMGRLLIRSSPGTGKINFRIEDHYEKDSAKFRAALSAVRDVAISRTILTSSALAANNKSDSKTILGESYFGKKYNTRINFTPLTPTSSSLLLVGDRSEFNNFLSADSPKSFATNHAGAWGWSQGINSTEIALSQCNKKSKDMNSGECQLFAINDMLVEIFNIQESQANPLVTYENDEYPSILHEDDSLKLNLDRSMSIKDGIGAKSLIP
jgi:hypothetical protein